MDYIKIETIDLYSNIVVFFSVNYGGFLRKYRFDAFLIHTCDFTLFLGIIRNVYVNHKSSIYTLQMLFLISILFLEKFNCTLYSDD